MTPGHGLDLEHFKYVLDTTVLLLSKPPPYPFPPRLDQNKVWMGCDLVSQLFDAKRDPKAPDAPCSLGKYNESIRVLQAWERANKEYLEGEVTAHIVCLILSRADCLVQSVYILLKSNYYWTPNSRSRSGRGYTRAIRAALEVGEGIEDPLGIGFPLFI